MKKVVLSKRLQAVADMVSPGNRVCDVGCDHGFVSIYLVEQQISGNVIAMDVNSGPLERARIHISDRNLSGYIETRLSNGIEKLKTDEADTVILAGMGGPLMTGILSADKLKTESLKELILQPQSEIPAFRGFLQKAGYPVVREDIILEDNKFYFIMKAIPEGRMQSEKAPNFLLEQRHPVYKQYLEKELGTYHQILEEMLFDQGDTVKKQARIREIRNKVQETEQILKMW